MFLTGDAQLPTPPSPATHHPPPAPWNPALPLACAGSDTHLEDAPPPSPHPPTPALSGFLSQKALQMVAEGSTAQHVSRKEKKRKESQLGDLQVQNGSHHLTFSEQLWLTPFFHHNGKEHSSGTDAVWCGPRGSRQGLYCSLLSFSVSSQLSGSSSWTKNSSGGHRSSPLSTSPSVGSTTMDGRRSLSLQQRSKSDGSGKI